MLEMILLIQNLEEWLQLLIYQQPMLSPPQVSPCASTTLDVATLQDLPLKETLLNLRMLSMHLLLTVEYLLPSQSCNSLSTENMFFALMMYMEEHKDT
jgi:hypothetical protein